MDFITSTNSFACDSFPLKTEVERNFTPGEHRPLESGLQAPTILLKFQHSTNWAMLTDLNKCYKIHHTKNLKKIYTIKTYLSTSSVQTFVGRPSIRTGKTKSSSVLFLAKEFSVCNSSSFRSVPNAANFFSL